MSIMSLFLIIVTKWWGAIRILVLRVQIWNNEMILRKTYNELMMKADKARAPFLDMYSKILVFFNQILKTNQKLPITKRFNPKLLHVLRGTTSFLQ